MLRKKINTWISFLFLLPSLCFSQTIDTSQGPGNPNGKTFNNCYEASLKRANSVAIQQELVKQAETVYQQAIRTALPNISGLKTFGWPKAPVGNNSFVSRDATVSSNTQLIATQTLFQGFKEFAAQKEAKTLIEASKYDQKQLNLMLYQDVVTSFYTTLSLENDIKNANEELAQYDVRIKDLKAFIRIGRSQVTDELTTASQAQALRAQVKQTEGALKAQRAVLAYLTGFDNDVPLQAPTVTSYEGRPLQDYLANVDQRPDVLGNYSRQLASDHAVTIARGDHWPTLTLQGDYFIERNGVYKRDWDIMVNLTVPIFSWGATNAAVNESISKRTQATLQVNETKRLAERQIRTYYETYVGDRESYLAFIDATNSAQKGYEANVRDYRRGLVTNLDVLQSLITYQESRRSRDKAYYSMLSDIELMESSGGFRTIITQQ